MKNRSVLRKRSAVGLAVVALAGSLTLAACSSDDDSKTTSSPSAASTSGATAASTASPADTAALAKVTVTGDAGKKPTVTLPTKPFTVSAGVSRVVSPGTGATIKEGDFVGMDEVAVQGSDGSALGDTYSGAAQYLILDPTSIQPAIVSALEGQKEGVRVLYAAPSQDSSGKTVTYVYSIEVKSSESLPKKASGTKVTPKAGLPTVKLDSSGKPSITVPKGYKAPKTLTVQTLIKGDGPKVKATDSVAANYTGWLTSGKQFDSSWDRGAPAAFSLDGGVITGWTKGLTGQTVGSQVLLIVPASEAYADSPPSGSNIPKNAPLIFVIDILAAGS